MEKSDMTVTDDYNPLRNLENAATIAMWRDHHGNTMLHLMARSGEEPMLRLLVTSGYFDVNTRNERDETPLICVDYTKPENVRLLLDAGANVSATNFQDQSPLHLAVAVECIASIELLLEAGAETDLADQEDRTALHYAVELGNLDIVRLLIDCGASVNVVSNQRCLLSIAARTRNEAMVSLLLENGALVNHVNPDGTSPLHFAVWLSNCEIARSMIEQGADVNRQDNDGFAVLHEAVYEGNLEQVKLLLAHGADMGIKTLEGDTPLHWAAFGNTDDSFEIMRLLLERGADCNDRDVDHTTPFHFALKRSERRVVQMLVDFGADVGARNFKGETALHFAAENHHVEVIEFVLDRGFAIDEANLCGFTALHYAAESGNTEGCRLLLGRGARVNSRCLEGRTPLYLATRIQQVAPVQVLLDYGADVSARTKLGESILETVQENMNEDIRSAILRHMARREGQGFGLQHRDLRAIQADEVTNTYFQFCVNELQKMRRHQLSKDVTLFDALISGRALMGGYARNEEVIKHMILARVQDYPIYLQAVKDRFFDEVRRQRLMKNAAGFLCEIFNLNDPQHIVNRRILSFLKEDDLRHFDDTR